MTAMYMLDDVGPKNGGTLVIPGSHVVVSQAPPGHAIPELPPPINVVAKRGTIMLFDHRLLHGTGVNHTAEPRHVLIAGYHRTWMRTQEAWLLSAAPDVLERASPRLRQRLGFSAHTIGTVEGHGLGASGDPEDEFSSVLSFRQAMDRNAGGYQRIRALSGTSSSEEELLTPFTFRSSASGRRAIGKAQKMGLIKGGRLNSALALSGGSDYRKRGTGSNALGVGESARAGRSRL